MRWAFSSGSSHAALRMLIGIARILSVRSSLAASAGFNSWRGCPTGSSADGHDPLSAIFSDLNGDGLPEVAADQWTFASGVHVLRDLGDSAYGQAAHHTTLSFLC